MLLAGRRRRRRSPPVKAVALAVALASLSVTIACGDDLATTMATEISGAHELTLTSSSSTTSTSTGEVGTSTTADPTTSTTSTTGVELGYCGDKIVQGEEECDEGSGNTDEGACTTACKHNICGDGLRWVGVEQCDLGDANSNGWKCTLECKHNICGDGHKLEHIEYCDWGEDNDDEGECTTDCKANVCGDGFVLKGFEECDDGFVSSGDGCSGECLWEQAVFVTAETFSGDLGGVAGADAICHEAAKLGGLLPWASDDFTYKAWIADPECAPKNRFPHAPRAYRRTDGYEIASSFADLIDGELALWNFVTESGDYFIDVDVPVWTAVRTDGSNGNNLPSTTCNGWTLDGDFFFGNIGNGALKDGSWTQWIEGGDWVGRGCHQPAHLYCVQINCLMYPDYCEPDYCAV